MTAELHLEEFCHLVDLSHDSALVAWGAFCFVHDDASGRWRIADDDELRGLTGRSTCIGSSAESFGPATVRAWTAAGDVVTEATTDRTWVWLRGLEPDTEYRYEIVVDGRAWAAGERRDWVPSPEGGYDLAPSGRSYDLRFRTWPHPDVPTPPLRFVAIGDYGVGIRSDSESSRRQRRVAEVLDTLVREHEVRFVISLGDNIYQGEQGQVDQEGGGEDDEWYSSFFEPYRYAIARVPVLPAIGNHDTTETEGSDDRRQMEDNFHLAERFHGEPDRASVGPGLFYRLRFGRDVELVCLDTSHAGEPDAAQPDASQSDASQASRYFRAADHQDFLRGAFAERRRWVIPFSHHPVYCAGPEHGNDDEMREHLEPLFAAAGVRLALAGHEHNFQVSEVAGRTHVVSGAGGQLREAVPHGFADAGTVAWGAQAHLLLVEIDGDTARLTPVAGLLADGTPHAMTAFGPDNRLVVPPFVVRSEA